jgi:toxin YhaV
MERNNWKIRYHKIFNDRLNSLISSVEDAQRKDPVGYKTHPNTKLLAHVHNLIFTEIPQNPSNPNYHLGSTLGKKYATWKRAKNGLGRYRLFFKYLSEEKTIIHAWLNDENTLRTYGSKTDAYAVFKGMLASGVIPDKFNDLQKESISSS